MYASTRMALRVTRDRLHNRMKCSPTSATGIAWERTPWRATQRAAWEALLKGYPRERASHMAVRIRDRDC